MLRNSEDRLGKDQTPPKRHEVLKPDLQVTPRPVPKDEPKTGAKADRKSKPTDEPKTDTKTDRKPRDKVDPKPNPKDEPKPDTKPDRKPAGKVAPKPNPKDEPKPDTKPDRKPAGKRLIPNPSPEDEPKPDTKPDRKPAGKVDPKPSPKDEPKPDTKPDRKPAGKVDPKPSPKDEPKPGSKVDPSKPPKVEVRAPRENDPVRVDRNRFLKRLLDLSRSTRNNRRCLSEKRHLAPAGTPSIRGPHRATKSRQGKCNRRLNPRSPRRRQQLQNQPAAGSPAADPKSETSKDKNKGNESGKSKPLRFTLAVTFPFISGRLVIQIEKQPTLSFALAETLPGLGASVGIPFEFVVKKRSKSRRITAGVWFDVEIGDSLTCIMHVPRLTVTTLR